MLPSITVRIFLYPCPLIFERRGYVALVPVFVLACNIS